MNEELYSAMIDYIFNYCTRFQTADEGLAIKTFRHDRPGMLESVRKFYKSVGWIIDSKEVEELTSGGFEAFKINVATRIFNEHRNDLNLNLCPKCGKIARTPWAQQCRFCLNDWH